MMLPLFMEFPSPHVYEKPPYRLRQAIPRLFLKNTVALGEGCKTMI